MTTLPGAVVLVSGGLDSCVSAAISAQKYGLFLLHLMAERDPTGEDSTILRSVRAFRMEDLCGHAGFARWRIVLQEGPMAALYELRP